MADKDLTAEALDLISKQIAIVRRLQTSIADALDRNDSGTAQRLIESCDQAFNTFANGVKAMAIDVSNLKDVLKSSGANADVIQALGDRLSKIEQTIQQLDPTAIANLQTDVSDIKTAIQELNAATSTK